MISCSDYDYIEIVCMYQYPIKIMMKTGDLIECIALDTEYNPMREECMKVSVQGVETTVILDDISALKVCIENPHFNSVSFV